MKIAIPILFLMTLSNSSFAVIDAISGDDRASMLEAGTGAIGLFINGETFGSGSYLGGGFVLTARHNVENGLESIVISDHRNPELGKVSKEKIQVFFPPVISTETIGSDVRSNPDIAIIRVPKSLFKLLKPVKISFTKRPASQPTIQCIVGAGMTDLTHILTAGELNAGRLAIEKQDADTLHSLAHWKPKNTQGISFGFHGDSGAPVFSSTPAGKLVQTGVMISQKLYEDSSHQIVRGTNKIVNLAHPKVQSWLKDFLKP